jgi:hypothetical protein
MSLIDEILFVNDGNRTTAVAVLAHGLMKGDKATGKMGYSRKAAVKAAINWLSSFTDEDLQIIDLKLNASLVVDPVSYGPPDERLRAVKAEIGAQRERHATPSIKRAVAKVDGKPFIAGPTD